MVGSKCDLKMHVRNVGYPFPLQTGAQNHCFRRLRNLRATLTACVLESKRDISRQFCALQTTRVSYIVSKRHELWSTNVHKLDVGYHRPCVTFAFHFIARLRKRRSANIGLTLTSQLALHLTCTLSLYSDTSFHWHRNHSEYSNGSVSVFLVFYKRYYKYRCWYRFRYFIGSVFRYTDPTISER